jgi:hypothetical protein
VSANPTTLFDLVNANDMSLLYPLTHAYGRSLKPVFNGPGTFSFTLPLDAEEAYFVANRSTGAKITRNDQVIWSGGVTNIVKSAQANTMSVTATGWLEEFDHRYVRKSEEAALTFASAFDGLIAQALVNACNAQTDTFGIVRPVRVIFDDFSARTNRTRSYHVGDNYGASIRELTTIENGGDIKIDPVTRAMRFVANTEYADRPNVRFGYGTDPNNLADANETSDGTNLFNRENAVTSAGIVASTDDREAIERAGVMLEEWVSLSDVSDVNIAAAYANSELVVKSHGLTTYQLTSAPFGDLPRPYDDFDWGDQAYFSVDKGAMQIEKQAVRIFAGTINYSDEGDEVLAEIEVAMSS